MNTSNVGRTPLPPFSRSTVSKFSPKHISLNFMTFDVFDCNSLNPDNAVHLCECAVVGGRGNHSDMNNLSVLPFFQRKVTSHPSSNQQLMTPQERDSDVICLLMLEF